MLKKPRTATSCRRLKASLVASTLVRVGPGPPTRLSEIAEAHRQTPRAGPLPQQSSALTRRLVTYYSLSTGLI